MNTGSSFVPRTIYPRRSNVAASKQVFASINRRSLVRKLPSRSQAKVPDSLPTVPALLKPTVHTRVSHEQLLARTPDTCASDTPRSVPLTGLLNVGNTCFLNAVLQCLLHTPQLAEFFNSRKLLKSQLNCDSALRGRLAVHFHKLLTEVQRGDAPVSPLNLKLLIGKAAPQFSGFSQHDAAEFFQYFLDLLHQDLNRVRGKVPYKEMRGDVRGSLSQLADEWWEYSLQRDCSIVTDLFQGQQVSVITCTQCKAQTVSCDAFTNLSLPIPASSVFSKPSIKECFQAFVQESAVSSYRCDRCGCVGRCRQSVRLHRLPQVLAIQLKRFTTSGVRNERVATEVVVTEELDLQLFCTQPKMKARYTLYAVAHHTGSLSFGHYVAECRDGKAWHYYNDAKVSPSSFQPQSSTAYVLFYSLADSKP